MGYLSCNADSAIAICDQYNWDRKKIKNKTNTNTNTNKNNRSTNKPIKIRDFTYNQLVKATNGFSADSFLGKGSHGTVYKAVLDNGKLIAAVKKSYPVNPSSITTTHNNCSTACITTPAENEIEILSRIQHPRLVNLIGYCTDKKLLVVQYMRNGSLYSLLHSTSKPPGWTRRVRFALQVAKAIHALHAAHPPVIHRDVKSSNVLIDEKGKARLGDFGLALRGHVEDVRVKCTPPAGTLGYLDPGYLAPSDLSSKSDVFSFGILLLEIISGRNAIDVNYSPPSIVDWAVPLIKRGDFLTICDHRIESPADPRIIKILAVLAAKCVRSTAEKRPGMAEVVEGLKFANKRVHAPLLWTRLRMRVGETREFYPVVVMDPSEEVVNSVNIKTVRSGSRRNRKVSSVEYGNEMIGSVGERVMRSKSIGSDYYYRRKTTGGGVAVKIPLVKLSKSRSMGVLHTPTRLPQYCSSNKINRGFVFEIERDINPTEIESSVSKMFIGLDQKSELQMQEKPLVSI